MKKNIGFRLKFDNMLPEDIYTFLINYLNYFDRFEIKISKSLVSSGKLDILINICEKIAKNNYSVHLPKNIFTNEEDFITSIKTISFFKQKKIEKICFVTHLPYLTPSNYIDILSSITSYLENTHTLLLENEITFNNNIKYLDKFIETFLTSNRQILDKTKICIDIGHLLFGCTKEGLNQIFLLDYILNNDILLNNILQFHIHDFNDLTDHLLLGKGKLDIKALNNFFKNINPLIPIIIEVNINKPQTTGILQIDFVKRLFLC